MKKPKRKFKQTWNNLRKEIDKFIIDGRNKLYKDNLCEKIMKEYEAARNKR